LNLHGRSETTLHLADGKLPSARSPAIWATLLVQPSTGEHDMPQLTSLSI
jgi:hypothetical protein